MVEESDQDLIRRLRAALTPFATFADPRRSAPPSMPITQGSRMAKRQLTMGDCYTAADVLKGERNFHV